MLTKANDFKIVKAANGEDTMLIQNENGEYIYVHSKYEPTVIAKKLTEQYEIGLDTIVIMFGIGLGYELINIIKKTTSRNNILVIEPNKELIDLFLSKYKLEEMVDIANVKFYTTFEEIEEVVSNEINMINSNFLSKYYNLAYQSIYTELHKQVYEITDDTFRIMQMFKNTVFIQSYNWFDIISRNYAEFLNSYDTYKLCNLFKEKPAILVSRGPSLNKNVELLKKAKGKIVILSVYTAYPVLIANGIEPDFVLSIDAKQELIPQHKSNGFDPFLLANGATPTELISAANKGKAFLVGEEVGVLSTSLNLVGKKFNHIDTGGSVACTAFSIATYMGCSPIVLIGQDLAYTNEQAHAIGTQFTEDISKRTSFLTCDGYYGDTVNTSEQLYNYRLWFEEKIKKLPENIVCINATEGGANIKGATNKSLQYVIDTYAKEEFVDNNINEKFSNNLLFNDNDKLSLFNFQKDCIVNMINLLDLSIEALELSKKLEKLYKHTDMPKERSVIKIVDQLDKIDFEIDKFDNTLNYIYSIYQLSIFAKRLPIDGDFSEDVIIVKRNLMKYEKLVEVLEFSVKVTYNSLSITNAVYEFDKDLDKWLEDTFLKDKITLIKDYKSTALLIKNEVTNE